MVQTLHFHQKQVKPQRAYARFHAVDSAYKRCGYGRGYKSWRCPFTHLRDPTPAPNASAIDTHALSDTENNPYNQHSIYSVKSKYVSVPSEMTTIQFSHSIIGGTEVVQRNSIATQPPFLLGFPYYLDYSSPFIRNINHQQKTRGCILGFLSRIIRSFYPIFLPSSSNSLNAFERNEASTHSDTFTGSARYPWSRRKSDCICNAFNASGSRLGSRCL